MIKRRQEITSLGPDLGHQLLKSMVESKNALFGIKKVGRSKYGF
jgi:hypothetical protein